MDEVEFCAHIVNQFGRPRTARFPGDLKGLPADLSKEGREVLKIRRGRLKGRGALEDDHLDLQSFRDFECFLPRLPNLPAIAK